MHKTERDIDPSIDLNAQRDATRQSLDEIANDIGMAMRDVDSNFPVDITVRNCGGSLVTIATPLDPSVEDWRRASDIVCRIIEERIGCKRLRGRELPCAVANMARVAAADVAPASNETRDAATCTILIFRRRVTSFC